MKEVLHKSYGSAVLAGAVLIPFIAVDHAAIVLFPDVMISFFLHRVRADILQCLCAVQARSDLVSEEYIHCDCASEFLFLLSTTVISMPLRRNFWRKDFVCCFVKDKSVRICLDEIE